MHGKTGLLVPPGQPKLLAAALQRLIDDPALRQQLGHAGQVHAQAFSSERVGAAYAAHFRSVVAAVKK